MPHYVKKSICGIILLVVRPTICSRRLITFCICITTIKIWGLAMPITGLPKWDRLTDVPT